MLPNRFKGVSKDILFPLYFRIGGVEHDCCLGVEQTLRHSFTGVAFQKFVGNARTNHPIHPAF